MKARLMDPEGAFDSDSHWPDHAKPLTADLELEPVIAAMADGDPVIERVARGALLKAPANSLDAVRHRQAVLTDARLQPELVRRCYELTRATVADKPAARLGLNAKQATVVIRNAASRLSTYIGCLERLRGELGSRAGELGSTGLRQLAETLYGCAGPEQVAGMTAHLAELPGQRAFLVSARLGPGNKGVDYRLRARSPRERSRFHRWLPARGPIRRLELGDDEDETRAALREFQQERLTPVSATLRRAAQDAGAFLTQLRDELAFYVGCLNLEARLASVGAPVTMPEVVAPDEQAWQASGLVDVALALTRGGAVVGNDLDADGRRTLVVTGANRGGKSTFLRSLGQAQLMAQAGAIVGAGTLRVSQADAVLTHFPRAEDRTLRHGKLDEELQRMSQCIDALTPRGLLLSNESCGVTNQREGARIVEDVATAVHAHGARAVYVTHLYELAAAIRDWDTDARVMLRAERDADSGPSFRIVPGEPERTSHADDLYARIIGDDSG